MLLINTIILLINRIPIALKLGAADHKERAAKEEEKRKLHVKLSTCVVQDRKKFDIAWAGYIKHAEVGL